MIAGRMLERLAALDLSDDQLRLRSQQDNLLISIHGYVGRLFNTPVGSVQVDHEFGVPDLSAGPGNSEILNPDMMAQALLAAIHRYEPRLLEPKLQVVLSHADNVSTRLVLDATAMDDGVKRSIRLQGTIASDGTIELDPVA